jgi:hypothetical protein
MADDTASEAAASIATLMGTMMEDAGFAALDLGRLEATLAEPHAAALQAVVEDLVTLANALVVAVRLAARSQR